LLTFALDWSKAREAKLKLTLNSRRFNFRTIFFISCFCSESPYPFALRAKARGMGPKGKSK